MDTIELVLMCIVACAALAFRCLAPFWIGRAARKRGQGHGGWIVCGLLFGPLIVGLIYLCTAHRAPILFGHERDPIF